MKTQFLIKSIEAVMAVLDQLDSEIDLAEFKRKKAVSSESTSPSDAEEVELATAE